MGGGFILRDRNLFVALRCGRGRFVAFQPTNDTMTHTHTATATASARFEIVHTSPDTGREEVLATRWTLAAAIAAADRSGASRRPNTEIRFGGVTLMHSAPGEGMTPTAFRPAAH